MAKYERANHDTDQDERVFDGGDDDDGSEGSHLPVVIIIAILVLVAFGGVVWLAYNQGVARGRGDTPVRVAATQPAKTDGDSGIKVYQQRAGTDEDSESRAAPAAAATPQTAAPPAAAPQAQVQAAPIVPPPVQAPPVAPKIVAQAPAPALPPPPVAKPAPQPMTAAKPAVQTPAPAQTATKPPAALGMARPGPVATTQAAPPAVAKPAVVKPVETAKPAASGGYYLQIGAYKSDAEARAAWKTYAGKHSTLLNGFGADVQRADLGDKGVWYRLRVASFADKDTAAALCDRLKAQGGACYLAK